MEKLILITRHARRRMKWRNISEVEVHEAIQNPDLTETTAYGRINAIKTISGRRLKVTYREDDSKISVITALMKG